MKHPLVSIVIPVHNRARMVCDTLASVRAQTYPLIEIIVVDDGSTDNSLSIVKSFALEKRVFHLESARGPSAGRNLGVDKANGDYVVFLDDDDLLHPGHIEALMARAAQEDDTAVVCARWRRFWTESGKVGLGPIVGGDSVPGDDWLLDIVNPSGESRILLPVCLWSKEACTTVRWDEELFTNCDVDFFVRRLSAGSRFIAIDAGMAYYRTHGGPRVAGTLSERALQSGTRYVSKLCQRLKAHPNREAYALGIRRSLMSLAVTWATVPGNGERVEKLVSLYREWGGRALKLPVAPRNPIKRAIAAAALRIGGPGAVGRLMRLSKKLSRSQETVSLQQHSRDPCDKEDLQVLESLLQCS